MVKIWLIGLIGMFCFLGCEGNITPFEVGNSANPRKVLIATGDSAFKKKIVSSVIEKLGTRDCYIKVIGLDQLAAEETMHYKAILIVCKVTGGIVESRANAFLQEDPANSKVVLLVTFNLFNLTEKAKTNIHVDAVTSASKDTQVKIRTDRVVELLIRRL